MTEWGNYWITCLTCGNKRHTGTDFNANLLKTAHESNHKGHQCIIHNANICKGKIHDLGGATGGICKRCGHFEPCG